MLWVLKRKVSMFKLMDKKLFTILHSIFLFNKTYVVYNMYMINEILSIKFSYPSVLTYFLGAQKNSLRQFF